MPPVMDALAMYMGVPVLTTAGFKNIGLKAPGTPMIRSMTLGNSLAAWDLLLADVSNDVPTLVALSTPAVRLLITSARSSELN